ncbi:SAM-dependent methyltransferase [Paramagnetospirillum caucaseum]|uniref:SAM-dependent methyltransferase n=1 Tax=Paramagnetospirillum caucaseum TaxID=1244869 RepID=M3ADG8_9PROT|nr:class I SAM-dependent methyltransferase [Paramagnetospirillum caucaseum]EME70544.1 SAM-dependent methyltransferase [Paramagnetospirillum caucaseum]
MSQIDVLDRDNKVTRRDYVGRVTAHDKAGGRILDVGCGKAHLPYEFTQAVTGVEVASLDISDDDIADSKEEARSDPVVGNGTSRPWPDGRFDFVISINTLHNLMNFDLFKSDRNEREKANLLYWPLTCETVHPPAEWVWFAGQAGYTGDLGFISFE